MNLFNAADRLRKYDTVAQIIDDYFETRLEYYSIRKSYLIKTLQQQLLVLTNKSRYIQELLEDTIDLRKKKKPEITALLLEKKYDVIDNDEEFKYLIKMPMDSVSEENVAKLLSEHKSKSEELEKVQSTTIQEMWTRELIELERVYNDYIDERRRTMIGEPSSKKKVVKTIKKPKTELVLMEK
jgi:DNA topoisomerase-2